MQIKTQEKALVRYGHTGCSVFVVYRESRIKGSKGVSTVQRCRMDFPSQMSTVFPLGIHEPDVYLVHLHPSDPYFSLWISD